MAESIAYAIAQAFTLPGAGQTATVVDDSGTHTADFNGVGSETFRVLLAERTGLGTEDSPREFIRHVQDQLGAFWQVDMRPDGLVQITYTGVTVDGELTWGASCRVQTILGGFTDLTIPKGGGGNEVAPHQPTHLVLAVNANPDSGWIRTENRFAGAVLPGGKVYGWVDPVVDLQRRVTLTLHPKTDAVRQDAGFPSSMPGTPMFPDTAARMLRPLTSEPEQAPPWSVLDFLGTAAGRSLGMVWGTFQDVVAGTDLSFDVGYLLPDSIRAGARPSPTVALYDARWNVADVAFTLVDQLVIA